MLYYNAILASRPSEHPPVRGKNVKTFRWDLRLQIQNLFMVFKRVSSPIDGGSSYHVDFVTVCKEYRVLSLSPGGFISEPKNQRTKERTLLMAHKLRPSTEA